MRKPDFFVAGPNPVDEFVEERIVRALQRSPLHLYTVDCLAPDPEHPDDENVSIMLTLVLLTDGRRGFLVIGDDFYPPCSAEELDELVQSLPKPPMVLPRGTYAIRIATRHQPDSRTQGVLDLRNCESSRQKLEDAYETAFSNQTEIDHAAFLKLFEGYNWGIRDETEARAWAQQFDGYIDMPPLD